MIINSGQEFGHSVNDNLQVSLAFAVVIAKILGAHAKMRKAGMLSFHHVLQQGRSPSFCW